jgi:hypothetical protein
VDAGVGEELEGTELVGVLNIVGVATGGGPVAEQRERLSSTSVLAKPKPWRRSSSNSTQLRAKEQVHLADPVGFVGSSARHHELGPIALAVVKRNVARDALLDTHDLAAVQQILVEPEVGLHLRPMSR